MTLGGCDLGVLKPESWRKTRLDKVNGKTNLLMKVSKDWVDMKAKLRTALFLKVYKVCFFSVCICVHFRSRGMDAKLSNLNVNLNPVA